MKSIFYILISGVCLVLTLIYAARADISAEILAATLSLWFLVFTATEDRKENR